MLTVLGISSILLILKKIWLEERFHAVALKFSWSHGSERANRLKGSSLGNSFKCLAFECTLRYLVELQNVQQIEKFPVLLVVLQLDVVLLQAVQGQLGLVVHKDLHGLG